MSSRARSQRVASSEPWWGAALAEPTPSTPAAGRRRPAAASVKPLPLPVRILLAPLRWLVQIALRSSFGRRLLRRAVVALAILLVLAGSGGVILLNNLVIGRTAELGELSDRRRELRRDNALLGAEAARLAAGPVVIRRASRELGMVRPAEMPRFTYLFEGSRTLTPLQRRRVMARNARLRAQASRSVRTPAVARAVPPAPAVAARKAP